jgi:hypothetical protein
METPCKIDGENHGKNRNQNTDDDCRLTRTGLARYFKALGYVGTSWTARGFTGGLCLASA